MKLNANVTAVAIGAGLTLGGLLLMNSIGKGVQTASYVRSYAVAGRGSPRVKYVSDRAMRIPMNSFVGRSYQTQLINGLQPQQLGLPNTYQSASGDYNSINVFDLA